jgi:hypothetical protein
MGERSCIRYYFYSLAVLTPRPQIDYIGIFGLLAALLAVQLQVSVEVQVLFAEENAGAASHSNFHISGCPNL